MTVSFACLTVSIIAPRSPVKTPSNAPALPPAKSPPSKDAAIVDPSTTPGAPGGDTSSASTLGLVSPDGKKREREEEVEDEDEDVAKDDGGVGRKTKRSRR